MSGGDEPPFRYKRERSSEIGARNQLDGASGVLRGATRQYMHSITLASHVFPIFTSTTPSFLFTRIAGTLNAISLYSPRLPLIVHKSPTTPTLARKRLFNPYPRATREGEISNTLGRGSHPVGDYRLLNIAHHGRGAQVLRWCLVAFQVALQGHP